MLWQTPPTTLPILKSHTIHLWLANLDTYICPNPSVLSPDEQTRANRFKFAIHQNRFTAARTILRQILAKYLNQPLQSLQFEYTPYGKPFLSNSSVHFNLSHSQEWALFAVGLEEKLGVDIEYINKDRALKEIAVRFFSDHENQQLNQLPEQEQQKGFFRIWTCKEAFIKAMGEGLSFPLQDFDVHVGENMAKLVRIKQDEKEAGEWSCVALEPVEDFMATLAVRAPIEELKFWQM